MKLLFIVPHPAHSYDSAWVRDNPCGGTEKAATFLCEALQRLGEQTRLVTTWDEVQGLDLAWPDVVITQHAELFKRFAPKVGKVWWCHQATDRPFIRQGARLARRYADAVVTLSCFQQQNFQSELGMESVVIGYGIWKEELAAVTEKDPGRLIYSSVPQRGLADMPALFREIRAQEPSATLAVCSSNATWGSPEFDAPFEAVFEELRQLPGVEVLGALPQRALYAQLARASVFFYPSTYVETYCLAMAEAMAHGCTPVVTSIGALPERWVPAVAVVRRAVSAIRMAQKRRRSVTPPPDWMEVAERWLDLLA